MRDALHIIEMFDAGFLHPLTREIKNAAESRSMAGACDRSPDNAIEIQIAAQASRASADSARPLQVVHHHEVDFAGDDLVGSTRARPRLVQ